jgi:TonB-dependent SusC/RagA subfamily outer membrane receptor
VVDGVILGGAGSPSTVDLDGLDIESIEVIRGAAASSMYGSRAASGVIAITTARGQGLPLGETRFTVRSEIGVTQAITPDYQARHHYFLMDPTNSYYVDADGQQVDRNQRRSGPLYQAFLDKPYPDPTYDNLNAILRCRGMPPRRTSRSRWRTTSRRGRSRTTTGIAATASASTWTIGSGTT